MSNIDASGGERNAALARFGRKTGRRGFLKWSGAAAAALAVGCDDDGSSRTITELDRSGATGQLVSFGSGDIGILNYAFALEQIESAFYERVVRNNFYPGATEEEKRVLNDIRDHEVAHREFFRAALKGDAIPNLTPNFGSINFNSRAQVLETARMFEEVGTTAYNGAGPLLKNPDFLAAAGKIVSVEARQVAALRDLEVPKSRFFAGDDYVNPKLGLAPARSPGEVLPLVDPFVVERFDTRGLPSADILPVEQWLTI
jgi:hypothetical protein